MPLSTAFSTAIRRAVCVASTLLGLAIAFPLGFAGPSQAAFDDWVHVGEPQSLSIFTLANGWTTADRYPRALGDVDGDGQLEVIGFGFSQIFVVDFLSSISFSGGGLLTVADGWNSQDLYPRFVGDVDGDGNDDVVGCGPNDTQVLLSTGSSFVSSPSFPPLSAFSVADGWTSQDATPRMLGDWNGDGRMDLIGDNDGDIWVALSTGAGFAAPFQAGTVFTQASGWTSQDLYPRVAADVTGDGAADLIGFGQNDIFVVPSNGTGVDSTLTLSGLGVNSMSRNAGWPTQGETPRFVEDVNGDGRLDLVGMGSDHVFVQLQADTPSLSFRPIYRSRYADFTTLRGFDPAESLRFVGDVDGDGAADLVGADHAGLELLLASTLPMPTNPVVAENLLPGTTNWRPRCPSGFSGCLGSDQVGQVEAYFDRTSAEAGETLGLHLSTNVAANNTFDIYRLGYYDGLGARLVASLLDQPSVPQAACPMDGATGRVECTWPVTHTIQVGNDWVSGIYLVKITRDDGYVGYATFTVRDDDRVADFLYQQPVTTYQAYNAYPSGTGKSLYGYNSNNVPASQVSFDRPYDRNGYGQVLIWELDLIMWLESEGFDVAYSTNFDQERLGTELGRYSGFLSTGHDEYWTDRMFDHVYDARRTGVDLAFFGSNAAYWRIILASSASGPERRMSRNGLFRNSSRREQDLMGIHYVRCCRGGGKHGFHRRTVDPRRSRSIGLVLERFGRPDRRRDCGDRRVRDRPANGWTRHGSAALGLHDPLGLALHHAGTTQQCGDPSRYFRRVRFLVRHHVVELGARPR